MKEWSAPTRILPPETRGEPSATPSFGRGRRRKRQRMREHTKGRPRATRDRPFSEAILLGERLERRVVGVRLGCICLGHQLRRQQVGRNNLHTVVVIGGVGLWLGALLQVR